MANITLNENPQLNLEMEAMTVNTEGHCDEWNRRHKQLLENDHYLSEEQKKNNEPEFTVAEKRENIASKEKMPKILGKIAKFFTDLKTVAFSGKYSDLDGKPAIVNNNTATEAGSALDARQANPNIDGTLAKQISDLNSDLNDINGSLNVQKYYGKLIATDLVKFRTELPLYNSIYIFGNMIMISFSVALTSNIDGSQQYHIITLPDLLSGIEWNNLCGSFLNSRLCPFVFSDNLNRITLIVQGQNGIVSAGDELRVWGIGFLNS